MLERISNHIRSEKVMKVHGAKMFMKLLLTKINNTQLMITKISFIVVTNYWKLLGQRENLGNLYTGYGLIELFFGFWFDSKVRGKWTSPAIILLGLKSHHEKHLENPAKVKPRAGAFLTSPVGECSTTFSSVLRPRQYSECQYPSPSSFLQVFCPEGQNWVVATVAPENLEAI